MGYTNFLSFVVFTLTSLCQNAKNLILVIATINLIIVLPMPIYMDLHILPGVKANDVAEAHRRDMLIQGEHNCVCMTYWIDEKRGNVFCLIDAPDQKAVEEMHHKAHGLIPNKIIEVNTTIVDSFLGRIIDPLDALTNAEGLKVFHDPSFRVLLVTTIKDPVLMQYELGKEKANELLQQHNEIIRLELAAFNGSEVEHEGVGFIASFTSAVKAVACANSIQEKMEASPMGLKIGIHGGEPVTDNAYLFGETIQLAQQLCAVNKKHCIAISSSIKELVAKDKNKVQSQFHLLPADEIWLGNLFKQLEKHWADAEFNGDDYCKAMAMSQSQFYRKTIALTGVSPNILLKDFRLEKAAQLIKKQQYAISEIAFETGFSSASYFTKCFKKKYGLLPMAYLDLL